MVMIPRLILLRKIRTISVAMMFLGNGSRCTEAWCSLLGPRRKLEVENGLPSWALFGNTWSLLVDDGFSDSLLTRNAT